jgi:folate-binding protein YgfZ
MARTVLSDKLASVGARFAEYKGVETAAVFTDAAREFAALRSACGVYDMGWRANLVLTGADRVRWLNGMVTNNIRDLARGHGTYNFMLNAQGHILADMYIYNRGEYLLVATDAFQAQKIAEAFDHFIIMDEVEVTNASEKLTALGVEGPKSREVMARAGIQLGALEPLVVYDTVWQQAGISVVRMPGEQRESYEIWLAPQHAPALWDALVAAGATPVGTEALEIARVVAGVPRYGQDIRERDLPQETEQHQALSFTKGCYLGQEIVERIRSRGAVHRMFTGFAVEGPVTPGTRIQAGGKDVGEITSVAAVPSSNGSRTLALGYIRRESGTPGAEVVVGEAKATVTAVPFGGFE